MCTVTVKYIQVSILVTDGDTKNIKLASTLSKKTQLIQKLILMFGKAFQ